MGPLLPVSKREVYTTPVQCSSSSCSCSAALSDHWIKTAVVPEEHTQKKHSYESCVCRNPFRNCYPHDKLHRHGQIMINHATKSYYIHNTHLVQSKPHYTSSTEKISPAEAFWAPTDAAASASQLAFNAGTSWRTYASPGVKCETSLSSIIFYDAWLLC